MNQQLLTIAIAVCGQLEVQSLTRLLLAAGSRNTVADLVNSAIKSKIRAEQERLTGKILAKMEHDGVPAERQFARKRYLGIGSTQQDAEGFVYPADETADQPTQ